MIWHGKQSSNFIDHRIADITTKIEKIGDNHYQIIRDSKIKYPHFIVVVNETRGNVILTFYGINPSQYLFRSKFPLHQYKILELLDVWDVKYVLGKCKQRRTGIFRIESFFPFKIGRRFLEFKKITFKREEFLKLFPVTKL